MSGSSWKTVDSHGLLGRCTAALARISKRKHSVLSFNCNMCKTSGCLPRLCALHQRWTGWSRGIHEKGKSLHLTVIRECHSNLKTEPSLREAAGEQRKNRSETELHGAGSARMSVPWILHALTSHLVLTNSMSHDWVKVKKVLSQVEFDNGMPRIF